ncbi:MAG: hypothetical protein DRJ01_07365 [Bacteroidetes bacterium]|nr:MAG: hypothetical protein DRJ01_07365 [Bacteroidota bacterium]
MYRKLIFIFACLIIHSSIFANFDFNNNCNKTFCQILNLEFDKAKRNIENEKKVNPENKLIYYFENYLSFFKTITSDSEDCYFAYKNKFKNNLYNLEKANKESPYYLYTQADLHFQTAILSYKFKDYIFASYHFYKAQSLIILNYKKHPNFYQNHKLIGSINLMINSIPSDYKWLANLFAINGSINSGIKELEYYYLKSQKSIFNTESIIFLSFAYQYFIQKNKRGYVFFNQINKNNLQNPIISLLYAKACIKADKNDEAIDFVNNYLNKTEFPIIKYSYYLLGTAKLNRLDSDADIYLKKYLNSYKGKSFIKASYQKLAWFYLINKNYNKYKVNINNVRNKGFVNTEADKQAFLEANQSDKINEVLLKSRLLFDGGYFIEAEKLLFENSAIGNSSIKQNSLEYIYRLARINHKLNRAEAKKYYKRVIKEGREMPNYFAKNSALQLALIYESELDFEEAEFYFKKCLQIKSNQYKRSIQFKAKAGLNRIKK